MPTKKTVDFANCGTPGNYRAHLRANEKPCRSCRQAEARRGSRNKPWNQRSLFARSYKTRRRMGLLHLTEDEWYSREGNMTERTVA